MMGGKFLFKKEAKISLSGAFFEVLLNDKEVYNDLLIEVNKGDVLTFGRAIKGNRIYLEPFNLDHLNDQSYFKWLTNRDVVKNRG